MGSRIMVLHTDSPDKARTWSGKAVSVSSPLAKVTGSWPGAGMCNSVTSGMVTRADVEEAMVVID